jgi:predicted dienelactone hydrolase
MKAHSITMLTALLAFACAARASVGYVSSEITDPARHRILKTKVWYPAAGNDAPKMTYDDSFVGHAKLDAPYQAADLRPVIVLSHGDKGSNVDQSWLAEALAARGYIVAAVTHWKNTWSDFEPAETVRVWERPKDLSFLLTDLEHDPAWSTRIDWARVGAAGHSSGGYAVLALAGALYSPGEMGSYCASPQRGADCGLVDHATLRQVDFSPAHLPYRDARVRAVFAMAPALGPALDAASLQAISIPVEIVAAADDEILPFDLHAGRVAAHIPSARMDRLSAGGHFVFMSDCTWITKAFTYFNPLDICGRRSRADRGAIRAQVGQEAVRFFDQALTGAPAG